jgi:transcription antitermination factor NusG
MNTLSNVCTLRDDEVSSDAGLTSSALPGYKSSKDGVSVEYAPDSNKQWYVLRVAYNRVLKAYEYIKADHTEAYIPMHYVLKDENGKKKRILEPLLPNLLFVYTTPESVELYVKHTPSLSFVNYYYNHFKTGKDGKNPPLTIPYDDMMNFIRISSVRNEHVLVVNDERCHYKSGETVLITGGDFAGVRGKVARVSGQQRVVVAIEGLCLIATAYVPTAFIGKIE